MYFFQILPRVRNNQLSSCCMSFWGAELATADYNTLAEDNDE